MAGSLWNRSESGRATSFLSAMRTPSRGEIDTMTKPENHTPWLAELNRDLAPGLNRALDELARGGSSSVLSMESLFYLVLANATLRQTTDIHIEPLTEGWRVRYRIDGRLHDVAQLPPEIGQRLIHYVHTLAKLDPVAAYLPRDASLPVKIEGRPVDLRVAFAPCYHSREKLAVRLLDPDRVHRGIGDLGLEKADAAVIQDWLRHLSGMCLVSGPTGSGKTTTLYAIIRKLDLAHHSLATIEDPFEYPLEGISQIQIDERHGLTFPVGLRALLRLDPDYLLLGEMRDEESALSAVEAAATGHLLLSTVHSADAVGVVTMLRSWGVADHQIATLLEVVISQGLVRKLCPKCKRPGAPSAEERRWLRGVGLPVPRKLWHAHGCDACIHTGCRGRTGVFEIWRRTEADYHMILDHADEHTLRQQLRRRGVHTVLEDAMDHVRQGITTVTEIQTVAAHTDYFEGSKPRGKPSGRRRTATRPGNRKVHAR